ncbi:zinc finger and BTB domain-containing protein 1 [Etheostoma cragini]|uniref:zinc finger and BTB domain-containing protein 1 n=1 Tax=Etheostoma cragini TaxID=417921 RepID=UPI00155ECEB4|nr:zinc finger and BTB domain-containing protein 1 [Etheostoma cragini]XP_034721479.1 zinc finger and BTB domain-containing protein 1 [Etheostoma cragini]XP_034721480.1 zinc finger and BTB domain-containing protein 1 [Etheostoma cragini]
MARPSHSDHVLQQLNNQREWGFLCDCLIAIGDTYFRAHRAVLAACSSYFRMMFIRDGAAAATAGRLDLSNMAISAECFDLILQLMYLGRIVVGGYEFGELKASMATLQMYYIPDSLDDLRDIRSANIAPSSSASSSSGAGAGKMMFGVRMYEQPRTAGATGDAAAAPEAERLPKAVSSSSSSSGRQAGTSRPEGAATPMLAAAPLPDGAGDQPCDLRKRPSGRGSALKERPRFGRTYTCDDCGFVFSCEKLLIEHILTCTNRKAFHRPRAGGDAESSASESVEEHQRLKGEDESERDGELVSVKTEPEENLFPDIEMVRVGEHAARERRAREPEPGASGLDAGGGEALEGHVSSGEDPGIPAKLRRVKEETQDGGGGAPCELCGAPLTEEDTASHYLSNHMGNICACGRCGRVLIKGRQLQEHAERCGDTQGGESDSPGEDEASLPEDPSGVEDVDLACPHCGALFQSESLALEHTLSCHEDLLRPPLLDDGAPPPGEPDHRRKHFCSICGKGFYQRCHLREHYTVHTKEKQFSCQTCGKQFLRERQLRLHTDMHRGMARYVCPVCDQGTFLKHDHVRHMISHLAAGETICQVCFQIFPGGEQLETHMDVHLYICGVCGEKFRLRKDMRSHYNAKHTRRL